MSPIGDAGNSVPHASFAASASQSGTDRPSTLAARNWVIEYPKLGFAVEQDVPGDVL
jgi:hypothetical protein